MQPYLLKKMFINGSQGSLINVGTDISLRKAFFIAIKSCNTIATKLTWGKHV